MENYLFEVISMTFMEALTKENKMFLAGKWVSRAKTIEVFDPQDHRLIATVPAANEEDVLHTIEEAKKGAKIAADMSTHERIAILNRASDWIYEHKEKFATTIACEGSKTIKEARKEVLRCIETLRISAEE